MRLLVRVATGFCWFQKPGLVAGVLGGARRKQREGGVPGPARSEAALAPALCLRQEARPGPCLRASVARPGVGLGSVLGSDLRCHLLPWERDPELQPNYWWMGVVSRCPLDAWC